MLKKTLLFAAAVALTGCATPPAMYNVTSNRTYQKNYDEVWEDLVQFLASKNMQIKNIAKDSGVIYAESVRFDDSFADCGKPGILHVRGRSANFNIFVNRSTGKPMVNVNAQFRELRTFDGPLITVDCNSTGKLEEAILNSVRQ